MRRSALKTVLAAASLAALSACGMVRSTNIDVAAQPAVAPPAAPTAPAPAMQAPAKPAAPSTPAPAAPSPSVSLPQPSPDQLMGLDAQGVARLLGQPGLKRAEGPAQVWQYANRLCVLDVVMYEEEGKRGPRVSYVELRDPAGGGSVPRNCFRSFLKNPPDGGA